MRRLIAASGLEWGHDILRHSFCSYCAQKLGAKEAARLSNHSEDVLHRDYREVVSDADAEAFWNLRLLLSIPHQPTRHCVAGAGVTIHEESVGKSCDTLKSNHSL